MSRSLPPRPHLEYLRKEAKRLLKTVRARDPDAKLSDAQFALAREYGFRSWSRLKHFVEAVRLDYDARVEGFLKAALRGDLREADAFRRSDPAVPHANIFTAAVSGELETLNNLLDEHPDQATLPGGPLKASPLLHLCFSGYARGDTPTARHMATCAALLLEHGADPNAFFQPEPPDEHRATALYGAVGVNNNPTLTRVLVEAGAEMTDGEAVYHGAEFRGIPALSVLFDLGADVNWRGMALLRKLDFIDPEGIHTLLDFGADPNTPFANSGKTALHQALLRGQPFDLIETLIARGADVNRPLPDGRTPVRLAVEQGRQDVEALLIRHGATPETVTHPRQRFLAACARADREAVSTHLATNPDLVARLSLDEMGLLVDAARRGNVEAVRLMLEIGFSLEARRGGTALNWAALNGRQDVIQVLLAYTPSEEDLTSTLEATVWAARTAPRPGADYRAIASLLIEAGADPSAGF